MEKREKATNKMQQTKKKSELHCENLKTKKEKCKTSKAKEL
jgi:hypothetical protein